MNNEYALSLKAHRRSRLGRIRCAGARLAQLALLVLLIAMLPARPALANPGDLDDTFLNPNPTGAKPTGLANYVSSLLVQADGKIVVGGTFKQMNGQPRGNLARLNSDGSLDMGFASQFAANKPIMTVVGLSDGRLLVGGAFTTVGSGTPANHIIRLNSDGSLDPSFSSSIFLDGESGGDIYSLVYAIAPLSDGDLLVGGLFSKVGGELHGNIARLNANGTLDPDFMRGLIGTDREVRRIAVQSDGKILISGYFTSVNGVSQSGMARLNANGTLDTTFNFSNAGLTGYVEAILPQTGGKMLVGGSFRKTGGSERLCVARLNADGSLDSSFQPVKAGMQCSVKSITPLTPLIGSKLLITGSYVDLEGLPHGYIAVIQVDGTVDTNFMKDQVGADSSVVAAAVQSDGKIIVGGGFTTMNGASRNMIARLNSNGLLDSGFMVAGANNEVTAVVPQPDGKILVGGTFTVMNGLPQTGIARLNHDGTTDADFFSNMSGISGGSGRVNAIALQPDGKILIGGSFFFVGGEMRNHLARLNPDGTVDTSFPNSGPPGAVGEVHSIVVQPDGKILVGGNLMTVGGAVHPTNFTRLNADGTLDPSFIPVALDSWVYSVALQPDGKIIIAGDFNMVNNQPRGKVARLYANGTLDTTYLNGVTGASNVVRWVDIDPQGNAIIGGWFTSVNGKPFNRIARLSKTDGSPDETFLKGLPGPDNGIRALEVQQDGKILIGGEFIMVNGTDCRYFALLNPNGSLADSFNCHGGVGITYNGWVNSVAQVRDTILLGGIFSQLRGAERGRVARLEGTPYGSVYLPVVVR